MKFEKKCTDHKAHYFVVDKSNTFSTCSHCGLVKKRKTIGWEMREEKDGMIAELQRDYKDGNIDLLGDNL